MMSGAPIPRLGASAVPRLKPHIRLQFNETRQQWIVQAPERVLMPDDVAVSVLRRCDGKASIAAIAGDLAQEYGAPKEVVESDIIEMLQELAEKGVIDDAAA